MGHCKSNELHSFPEQLQIWIYVFLVGAHRYIYILFSAPSSDNIYSMLFSCLTNLHNCPAQLCSIAIQKHTPCIAVIAVVQQVSMEYRD